MKFDVTITLDSGDFIRMQDEETALKISMSKAELLLYDHEAIETFQSLLYPLKSLIEDRAEKKAKASEKSE